MCPRSSQSLAKGPGQLHEAKTLSGSRCIITGTFKQRRRRHQRERQKKAIGLDWQNNNSARASSFFVHSVFAVRAGQQRVLWRT